MEYMILIYADERAWAGLDEKQLKAAYAEYIDYTQELIKAGIMKGGSELKPVSTATTVRVRGGKVLATDGPFAAPHRRLGSYSRRDGQNRKAHV